MTALSISEVPQVLLSCRCFPSSVSPPRGQLRDAPCPTLGLLAYAFVAYFAMSAPLRALHLETSTSRQVEHRGEPCEHEVHILLHGLEPKLFAATPAAYRSCPGGRRWRGMAESTSVSPSNLSTTHSCIESQRTPKLGVSYQYARTKETIYSHGMLSNPTAHTWKPPRHGHFLPPIVLQKIPWR